MVANGWRVCYTRKNEGCRRQMACKEYTKGRAPNMKKDELIKALKDRDNENHKNAVLWVLAVVGAIAAIAAVAYAVYRYLTPDYLEDFEEDFDDDFDNDFFSDEDEVQ